MRRGSELSPIRYRLDQLLARLRPAERPGRGVVRSDPGRGGAVAMVVVALLVAVAVGGWVWSARPHRLNSSAGLAVAAGGVVSPSLGPGGLSTAPAGPMTSSPSASGSAGGLVVDVVGKVHRPGVYRLPAGARVDDAVSAAGGVLAGVDPATVNLARKLTDGEQLVIGVAASAAPAGPSGANPSGTAAVSAGPLDLNTATAEQLDALPGVGPVLAQRIVDWRTQHGHFDSIEQLQSVSGIGSAKYADLRPLVTVG